MLTEKDYCDYETSVALKELGFNGFSQGTYDISGKLTFRTAWLDNRRAEFLGLNIIAPHLYDAQKWLREEKQIEVIVLSRGMIGKPYCYQVYEEDSVTADDRDYDIYEEALLEGIKEAINILKEKENGN